MHERECKGYISFNRGVNELNRGVNELNRGVNELNRGVNHSVARQGCNLLRAAVTSAVTSQGCCCGNLQIHPLDLGQIRCAIWYVQTSRKLIVVCRHIYNYDITGLQEKNSSIVKASVVFIAIIYVQWFCTLLNLFVEMFAIKIEL